MSNPLPKEITIQITVKEVLAAIQNENDTNISALHYTSAEDRKRERDSFIDSLCKIPPETIFTIKDFDKWPNPSKRTYADHLKLSSEILDVLIKEDMKKLPKINPESKLFAEQIRVIDSWKCGSEANPNIEKAVTAYFTDKRELPVIYAYKRCSTQGYGNHGAIMSNYHTANDRSRHYCSYVEKMPGLETLNTMKQKQFDTVSQEIDKFVVFLKEHKNILSDKGLKDKMKELTHTIKTHSSEAKTDLGR
jgi:hypothetical protein